MRRFAPFLALVAACGSGGDRLDPFPLTVDVSFGPAIVTASDGEDGEQIEAVIDTMAPVTVIDSFVPGEPEPAPRRRQVDLVLYSGTGNSAIPRVAFGSVSSFDLHSCSPFDGFCEIGIDDDRRSIRAIIGADVLSRGAVRFDIPASTMQLFPDVAGSSDDRGLACDAVFASPFAGGGTLVLGGSEVSFTGNRIALGACMQYDPDHPEQTRRGVDGQFILSTGIAVSLLAESAYERYAALVDDAGIAPALADLEPITLHLPAGPIPALRGSISRIALVGEGSDVRGPCQELYASHVLSVDACNDPDDPVTPCPCSNNRTFCNTAGAVEIDRAFQVAIVDDLDPVLQALRDELRPAYPEVDGILALSALSPLSIDVDYPNNRILSRCADEDRCVARPAVRGQSSLAPIAACLQ